MSRSRWIYSLLAAALLWSALSSFIPTTAYWRDSSEFVLSAFYLDVAHPAGFPLFSQLANLFALLPLGPIAWRVNAFSSFVGALNVLLLFVLTRKVLRTSAELSPSSATMLALIAPLILITTSAFLRQTFTSEVYGLHTLIILSLLFLYAQYQEKGDKRLLILSGFIGGLGLANHAALALALLPAALIICSDFRGTKNVIIPSFLAGLLGVSVYAYIPVRALHALPLNTGEAVTFKRFINQISDGRDRELRSKQPGAVDSSLVHLDVRVSPQKLLDTSLKDFSTMRREIPAALLIAGAVGLALLTLRSPRVGALFISSAAATWLFFLGWDADPWLPVFCMLGLGCAYLCGLLFSRCFSRASKQCAASCLAVLLLCAFVSPQHSFESAQKIQAFDAPLKATTAMLERIPYATPYMAEPSWFLLTYAQRIEGVREDVPLVYQASVLFPDHFARLQLRDNSGSAYDSWSNHLAKDSTLTAPDQNLAAFTDYVTRRQNLGFEPSMMLNQFYSAVAQCNGQGYAFLERGKPAACGAEFARWYSLNLQALAKSSAAAWPGFLDDTAHFYEGQLTNAADLLKVADSPKAARELLSAVCTETSATLCKLTSLNNLATYYMEEGNFLAAARLLRSLQRGLYGDSTAVRANLELATKNLDATTLRELTEVKP
ncbi:MAG: DUF2723 domain-containing protein [Deltaproteobacteria bacterium]|nr:DUF2723 domain-containing protein [Deltaproteobacteria bacterium]